MQDEEEYYYRSDLIEIYPDNEEEKELKDYDPFFDITDNWQKFQYLGKDGSYLYNRALLFAWINQESQTLKGTQLAEFLGESLMVTGIVIAYMNEIGGVDYEVIEDERGSRMVEIDFWLPCGIEILKDCIDWDDIYRSS